MSAGASGVCMFSCLILFRKIQEMFLEVSKKYITQRYSWFGEKEITARFFLF